MRTPRSPSRIPLFIGRTRRHRGRWANSLARTHQRHQHMLAIATQSLISRLLASFLLLLLLLLTLILTRVAFRIVSIQSRCNSSNRHCHRRRRRRRHHRSRNSQACLILIRIPPLNRSPGRLARSPPHRPYPLPSRGTPNVWPNPFASSVSRSRCSPRRRKISTNARQARSHPSGRSGFGACIALTLCPRQGGPLSIPDPSPSCTRPSATFSATTFGVVQTCLTRKRRS